VTAPISGRAPPLASRGVINRNFNYKLLLELGGAGHRRSDAHQRCLDRLQRFSRAVHAADGVRLLPSAGLADSTTPDDLLFIERPSSAELARALAGADGRLGLALRAGGARAG